MTAVELLEEIWRIYADPEQDRSDMYLWFHHHIEEIREALDVSAED